MGEGLTHTKPQQRECEAKMGQSVTRLKTSLFARATAPLQSHSNASLSNIPHALRLSPSLSLSLSRSKLQTQPLGEIDFAKPLTDRPFSFSLPPLSFTHLHFSPIGSKIVLQVLPCFTFHFSSLAFRFFFSAGLTPDDLVCLFVCFSSELLGYSDTILDWTGLDWIVILILILIVECAYTSRGFGSQMLWN